MKREFLKNLRLQNGAALSDREIDLIMAESGKMRSGLNQSLADLRAERDAAKAELEQVKQALADCQGQAEDAALWQQKCQELEQQLLEAQYGFCVKQAADRLQFTSKSAKNAFLAALRAEKLPMQDGILQGLEEFLEAYRQNDPGAFAAGTGKQPVCIRGGSGRLNQTSDGLRAAFGL